MKGWRKDGIARLNKSIRSVTLRRKLRPSSDQLENNLRMKYVNDLKSADNEGTIYIDKLQQEMDMNEYKKAYDLSCDIITNFNDFEVLDEYIGIMTAV